MIPGEKRRQEDYTNLVHTARRKERRQKRRGEKGVMLGRVRV